MSSHPYGLRGDPFASPATLSPKDGSRLIRRRVRAYNGDGGALFPIDTCDLIHELAGGIPDAMLEMAGHAMRIAAAEGAPAVAPDHVRRAAETAGGATAVDSPRTAEEGTEAPAEPEAGIEPGAAFEMDAGIQTRAEIPTLAQIAAHGEPAVPREETLPIADDDPDLPVFHPAAFALPSQPSEDLDPDARDWVSRFIIPAPGVGQHAGETSPIPHTRHAADPVGVGDPQRRTIPGPTPAPSPAPTPYAAAAGEAPPPARPHRTAGRRSRPRGRSRHRRSGSQGFLIAVAAVCIVAFVVRMSLRGELVLPSIENARPVPTSAPAAGPRSSDPGPPPAEPTPAVPEPAAAAEPTSDAAVREAPPVDAGRSAREPSTSSPAPAWTPGSVPAAPPTIRQEVPVGKFGLEVATFIFSERARVERDRLAALGIRVRIVSTLENGSRVYRVVVGSYSNPAAAERAADSMLSNGTVLQARVVRNP